MEFKKEIIDLLKAEDEVDSAILLNYYYDIDNSIKELEKLKDSIKEKFEKLFEDNQLKEKTIKTQAGQTFSLKLVETKRETFDKDQVKFYITPEQYKECLKTSNSSSLKITKLKGEK